MIKELMHDPIFLAGKSEVATKEDLQVAKDLLDTIMAHKDGCVGMAANMIGVRKRIIVCERDENRIRFVNEYYPDVLTVTPEKSLDFIRENSDHGGADVVLEVAGAENTFELAWQCARPNAIVTVVVLYDKAQTLPLPDMYGKNLTFKTGGLEGCDCEETLALIAEASSIPNR